MALGSPAVRDRSEAMIGAVAVLIGLGIVVAGTVYATRLFDGVVPATPPLFVVADALVAIVVAGAAWFVAARGHTRVAAWVAGLAASLAGYVAVVAAATAVAAAGGSAASIAVALEKSWYIVVMTLAAQLVLVAVEELRGRSAGLRAGRWLVGALAATTFLLGLAIDPGAPYADVSAPLAGTILGSDAGAIAFAVVDVAWILSTASAPVLAWRSAASAPRTQADHARQRLTIVAIGAATPLITLITCVLLMVAAGAGLVGVDVGSAVLSLVFCVPLLVLVAAVSAAVTASAETAAASLRIAIRWVLMGLWFLVGSQFVIVGASLIARGAGDSSLLAATAVAVVATAGFVVAYVPVSRRLFAFASIDRPAGPAPLADVLSPRERDVLERIARGHSNAAVAAELYLSERTVDSHVTAIFDKLGLDRSSDVNRRVQAAAAWIRAEATAIATRHDLPPR